MKFSAFILLVSFITYVGETIKIPLSFSPDCKTGICCTRMMKERCMKKQVADKPGKCTPQDCNTSCSNCPFTAVTIFGNYKPTATSTVFYKKEYPRIEISPLPDYIPDTWKPPNTRVA